MPAVACYRRLVVSEKRPDARGVLRVILMIAHYFDDLFLVGSYLTIFTRMAEMLYVYIWPHFYPAT